MSIKDWKLKLRYGKTKTTFKHFTVLGNCEVGELTAGFSCRPGPAFVGMKTWAIDTDQAADIFFSIGKQIGYMPYNKVEIYVTDPSEPPKEEPYGYDIKFTPYRNDTDD